jgi:serine/threonine protein kinase
MEFCCKTLNEVIKVISNELRGNSSQIMKTFCYCICCELFAEILESVHFLHESNIIHRDLKPANILITDGINERFVKLADFGPSVTFVFIDQSHTQGSGTMKYMTPEVRRTRKHNTKADIYSLGVIILLENEN